MKKLLVVALALALAGQAWAAQLTLPMLTPVTLSNTSGYSGYFANAVDIPEGWHASFMALAVVQSVAAYDSSWATGIEVFPMTAVSSFLADSLIAGVNSVTVQSKMPDSLAYGFIDTDDSNMKLDGFFCTNMDSVACANNITVRDTAVFTPTAGGGNSARVPVVGVARVVGATTAGGWLDWRRYVSSRVIYSAPFYPAPDSVGASAYYQGMDYAKRTMANADLVRPYPASYRAVGPVWDDDTKTPTTLGPNDKVSAGFATTGQRVNWFFMPLADAYGGRYDIGRLSAVVVDRCRGVSGSGSRKVALYLICTKN